MDELDSAAIGRGAVVALVIAVPAVIVQNLASPGSLRSFAFLVSLVGFGFGGYLAAGAEPRRGMTYGGLAGLAAGLVVLAVGILRRSAAGEPISWISQPFLALLALSSGLIGGYIAFRRSARDIDDTDASGSVTS
jgi:putative membrane protein (TIGR04086 family)